MKGSFGLSSPGGPEVQAGRGVDVPDGPMVPHSNDINKLLSNSPRVLESPVLGLKQQDLVTNSTYLW